MLMFFLFFVCRINWVEVSLLFIPFSFPPFGSVFRDYIKMGMERLVGGQVYGTTSSCCSTLGSRAMKIVMFTGNVGL